MLSLKRLNPLSKSKASITNANAFKPQKRANTSNKLFFPTFESRSSILFWVGFVVFFSLYGLATGSVFLKTWWDVFVFYIDLVLTYGFIVLFVVGYVHSISERLMDMPRRKMIETIVMVELILVPLATVATAVVKYLLVSVPTSLTDLMLFVATNTLMTLAFTMLFIYYFNMQYEKVRRYQQRFQRQLMEQNEQLKARITPHFFFNMLNTMQYLIETDKEKAMSMVEHVSTLYRVSFKDITEVAMLDEIALCQHYLNIEQYRFGSKLIVQWDLPDEDLLYDMVISSLTLQLVIEKMIVFVVEMTTATIFLTIRIDWQDDWVTIEVKANMPSNAQETIGKHMDRELSFNNQRDILRQFYGHEASIEHYYDQHGIETTIGYPLKDVAY